MSMDPTGAGQILHWSATALLLTLAVGRTLRSIWLHRDNPVNTPDWRWVAFMFLTLFAGRWPWIFTPYELNTDESQMIVGAHTLLSHPVFWRAVDGSTSGPMNFFAVVPLGVLSGWEGFAHARILAFLLLGLFFWQMYSGLSLLHGRAVARLALLPSLVIETLSNAADFHHYSSELLSVALMATAFHLMVRSQKYELAPLGYGMGGLLLGMVPAAKLQAAPIAAALGLIWFAYLVAALRNDQPRSGTQLIWLCLGAILPSSAFAMQSAIAGEWDNMIKSYIHANRYYVEMESGYSGTIPMVIGMAREAIPALPSAVALVASLSLGCLIHVRHLIRTPLFFLLPLAVALVAWFSVILPGRGYPHYLQLLVLPLSCLCAVVIAPLLAGHVIWQRAAFVTAIPLYALVALVVRLYQPAPPLVADNPEETNKFYFPNAVGAHIRPGEKLAIWGWSSYLYVHTKTVQATRRAMSQLMFEQGPLQLHFRQQYLMDLMNSRPPVFVDSTGPMSLFYLNPILRHEVQFPALAEYIEANYSLVEEYRRARIYLRNKEASPLIRSEDP